MRRSLWIVAALMLSGEVLANKLDISVEIPQLKVAEYHRPYVAVWIEDSESQLVSHLAVWYDVNMRENKGQEWLKDMRQWWRRGGRSLELPVDGISGATQAPGIHKLSFDESSAQLKALEAGEYKLVVEASREVGGREVVQQTFVWPPKNAVSSLATGSSELGKVTLTLAP